MSYYEFIRRENHDDGSQTAYYLSTQHAQGAWNEHEQHMAAATGVIAFELENFAPRDDMRIARLGCEIFGVIFAGEFSIHTQIIRAGRSIELIEATLRTQGKISIVARAWRLQTSDTTCIAGTEDAPQAISHTPWNMAQNWGGGFINSIRACSDHRRAGSGTVWLTSDVAMVKGAPTSDFVRLMGLVDAANGVVPRLEQREIKWIFPNTDLQIHLHRAPVGQWLGLQTVQQIGSDGIGLTSSILHDELGAFGRSEQILTVRKIK